MAGAPMKDPDPRPAPSPGEDAGVAPRPPGATRCASATVPAAERRSFLSRSMRWWDLTFLLIFAVVAMTNLVVLVSDRTGARDTAIALGALVLIVIGYYTYGRGELLNDGAPRLWPALAYLPALYALVLLIAVLSGVGSLLFFVAFASTWMMLPSVWAAGGSVLFTLTIVFVNVAAAGWTRSAWISGLLIGGFIAVTGTLMGLWISGLVSESERRQALIAELERTRSELGEAQHRAGALAERERLAAEIHDTIAQGLLSIVVHARAIGPDDADPEPRVRRIEQIAEENLAEARGLIEALQPAELREHSLPDACGRVCERFGVDSGVESRFRSEGEPRTLSANAEVVLLRAVQEALTNVRKHARAGAASVTLSYLDSMVRLTVTDDGVGFAPEGERGETETSGHRAGLRGIRNRAGQIDGRVEVRSAPGSGTRILVEVPS